MSVLAKLTEVGLDVEFEALLEKFLVSAKDAESGGVLRTAVDESGLKSPKTMKLIGELQRNKKINPGLYKEFVALNGQLESMEKDVKAVAKGAEPKEKEMSKKEEPKKEETKSEAKPEIVVVGTPAVPVVLSETEEEKIKERMAKYAEKMRDRLLAREKKLRERLSGHVEKRAQRRGLSLEIMQAINEKAEKIAVLRKEIKERREVMKGLRAEVKALKPKREKRTPEEKAKAKEEKKKAKEAAAAAAAPAAN